MQWETAIVLWEQAFYISLSPVVHCPEVDFQNEALEVLVNGLKVARDGLEVIMLLMNSHGSDPDVNCGGDVFCLAIDS